MGEEARLPRRRAARSSRGRCPRPRRPGRRRGCGGRRWPGPGRRRRACARGCPWAPKHSASRPRDARQVPHSLAGERTGGYQSLMEAPDLERRMKRLFPLVMVVAACGPGVYTRAEVVYAEPADHVYVVPADRVIVVTREVLVQRGYDHP